MWWAKPLQTTNCSADHPWSTGHSLSIFVLNLLLTSIIHCKMQDSFFALEVSIILFQFIFLICYFIQFLMMLYPCAFPAFWPENSSSRIQGPTLQNKRGKIYWIVLGSQQWKLLKHLIRQRHLEIFLKFNTFFRVSDPLEACDNKYIFTLGLNKELGTFMFPIWSWHDS